MTHKNPYSPTPPKVQVAALKDEHVLSLDITKGNTNGDNLVFSL